ncbi:MAG: OmpA family protein [Myxococcales bacterium]|nr:OmpA family protein [Myxococcales bacterium]
MRGCSQRPAASTDSNRGRSSVGIPSLPVPPEANWMSGTVCRAKSVRKFLIEQGIDEKRLISKGFGEQNPVQTNDTEEGRAANRRVEFTILERATK